MNWNAFSVKSSSELLKINMLSTKRSFSLSSKKGSFLVFLNFVQTNFLWVLKQLMGYSYIENCVRNRVLS